MPRVTTLRSAKPQDKPPAKPKAKPKSTSLGTLKSPQLRDLAPDDKARQRKIQVRMMASTNTTPRAMADLLGISVEELNKRYKTDMNRGQDYVYAAVSMKLVSSAMRGEVRSMLTWMRQFGGWTEVTRREITGKNGEPISFRNLDAASLVSVIEALSQAGSAGRGKGRTPAQIELSGDGYTDLDAVSGTPDEGAEE